MSFDKLFDGSDAHELCGPCGGTGILVGSECWFCDGKNAMRTVIDTTDVREGVCECAFAQLVVGDGCDACNPELAAELATEVPAKHAGQQRNVKSDFTITADQQAPATAAQECRWELADTENMIWESACVDAWSFIDGGPEENNVRYCHGCGGKLVISHTGAQGDKA